MGASGPSIDNIRKYHTALAINSKLKILLKFDVPPVACTGLMKPMRVIFQKYFKG